MSLLDLASKLEGRVANALPDVADFLKNTAKYVVQNTPQLQGGYKVAQTVQSPQFRQDATNIYNRVFNTPFVPGQPTLNQAIHQTAPTVAQDFQNLYTQKLGPVGNVVSTIPYTIGKGISSPFTDKPLPEKAGDVLGAAGAILHPFETYGGGVINTGIQAGSNLLQNKPFTQDLGKAYNEGTQMGAQLSVLNPLVGKILSPVWARFAPVEKTSINTYLNIAKTADNPEIKSQVYKRLSSIIAQKIGRSGVEGALSFAGYGAFEPAKTPEERLHNVLMQAGSGALLSGGIAGLGLGAEAFGGQVLHPAIDRYTSMTPRERQAGFIRTPNLGDISPQQGLSPDVPVRRSQLTGAVLSKSNAQLADAGYRIDKNPFKQAAMTPSEFEASMQLKSLTPRDKVNIIDYFRTPDRVLKKLGLGSEAEQLKQAQLDYQIDLPKQLQTITNWYNEVKNIPNSSENLFRYLDGEKVQLSPPEQKVAVEIRAYLNTWADKLKLPQDKRVADYITHLFEPDLIKKEFDPELAKLIDQKIPGSVYNPFLEKRLGTLGYKQDVWQALDAYTKRAARQYFMSPALDSIKMASNRLDLDSVKYLERYTARINMRPTEIDNLIDTAVKSSPVGYKLGQRPVAAVSRQVRQVFYRGALGLNLTSAMRNLSQGANTYAELGEKYTLKGYSRLVRSLMSKSTELQDVGVLSDNIVQDRAINATKKAAETMDKVLFSVFDTAETINRGAAYFGAKARALDKGLSEEKAIKAGIDAVRKTQFTFGNVDIPVGLNSDIGKIFTMFTSYTFKQAEFLSELAKTNLPGLIRYALASLLITKTIGKVYGASVDEFVPFLNNLKGRSKFGNTPPVQLAADLGKLTFGDQQTKDQAKSDLRNLVPLLFPAGAQINRSLQGIGAYQRGYSQTSSGNVRYPIAQTPSNMARTALFGQYRVPEADQYFSSNSSPLSEKQSQAFKTSATPQQTYQDILTTRQETAAINDARDKVKESGKGVTVSGHYVYYDPADDQTHSIPLNRQVEYPQLTGNSELDKKLISRYKSQLTAKANDITTLYEQGIISKDQAEAALNQVASLKAKASKGKKPKKVTVKAVNVKTSGFKLKGIKPSTKLNIKPLPKITFPTPTSLSTTGKLTIKPIKPKPIKVSIRPTKSLSFIA